MHFMFTGITQELGRVEDIQSRGEGKQLTFYAPFLATHLIPGSSIAINGCCLTAETTTSTHFTATAVRETLQCTNLGSLLVNDNVNLELPMQPQGFLGGHLVLGHVDAQGRIVSKQQLKVGFELTIELPNTWIRFIASKGSIAIDGVSLTPFSVKDSLFSVAIIPHTATHTTLGLKKVGDSVNIEVDILAKYCERLFMRKDETNE
jgi:riboflavin synthase, alpha subunit